MIYHYFVIGGLLVAGRLVSADTPPSSGSSGSGFTLDVGTALTGLAALLAIFYAPLSQRRTASKVTKRVDTVSKKSESQIKILQEKNDSLQAQIYGLQEEIHWLREENQQFRDDLRNAMNELVIAYSERDAGGFRTKPSTPDG